MDWLFTAGDLAGYLHTEVDPDQAAVTERVVFGWIKGATGITERPDPVPDDLWSWAVELGALQYSNPKGLASTTAGPFGSTWAQNRREAILAAIAEAYGARTADRPSGNFPPAEPWPDPLLGGRSSGVGWST